jgi:hypothetical protein
MKVRARGERSFFSLEEGASSIEAVPKAVAERVCRKGGCGEAVAQQSAIVASSFCALRMKPLRENGGKFRGETSVVASRRRHPPNPQMLANSHRAEPLAQTPRRRSAITVNYRMAE